jgi:acyl-CoA dehydrogenase
VDHGVQMHGGYGYILEYPIARAYADAQFWAVHGGVAPVRREAVASALLD